MDRFVWLVALAGALLLPGAARALDSTSPPVRVGASAGVLGTLSFGDDVGQDGYPDEFGPALWVQVDFFHADIGQYVALGGFFRLAVAGGYQGKALAQSIDPTRLATSPDPKMALVGVWGRFFPFGDAKVRPFLSLGLGYATAGATLGTCSQASIEEADFTDGVLVGAGEPVPPRYGDTDCPNNGVTGATRRHQGLGLTFGLGVRFDPTIKGFSEERWRLPISLELGYVKNVWLGMERTPGVLWEDSPGDPRLQTDPNAVASNRPNVDFLGLLLTVGFLR